MHHSYVLGSLFISIFLCIIPMYQVHCLSVFFYVPFLCIRFTVFQYFSMYHSYVFGSLFIIFFYVSFLCIRFTVFPYFSMYHFYVFGSSCFSIFFLCTIPMYQVYCFSIFFHLNEHIERHESIFIVFRKTTLFLVFYSRDKSQPKY